MRGAASPQSHTMAGTCRSRLFLICTLRFSLVSFFGIHSEPLETRIHFACSILLHSVALTDGGGQSSCTLHGDGRAQSNLQSGLSANRVLSAIWILPSVFQFSSNLRAWQTSAEIHFAFCSGRSFQIAFCGGLCSAAHV